MSLLFSIQQELLLQILRAITGRLFTKEQIRNISSHSVGRYISDIFPEDEEKKPNINVFNKLKHILKKHQQLFQI